MLLTARAISRAERAWLHEVLDGDGIRGADEQPRPQTHTRDRKD
ncbi:PadR family transcriptional regulator [Streptomyces purpurascens]